MLPKFLDATGRWPFKSDHKAEVLLRGVQCLINTFIQHTHTHTDRHTQAINQSKTMYKISLNHHSKTNH